MFCGECGRNIGDAETCPYCQCRNLDIDENEYIIKHLTVAGGDGGYPQPVGTKSRITAGLLQIFTGALGIGRFYLGYTSTGILQIVVSLITCGLGGLIWGLIDGIMILAGTVDRDGKGNALAA